MASPDANDETTLRQETRLPGAISVWTLTDGTTGMQAQAVALAAALCQHRPNCTHADFQVSPHPLLRALPRFGTFLRLPLYGKPQTSFSYNTLPPADEFPDILITCGGRVAGIGLALRQRARKAGVKTQLVQIQDPRLPPALFDALVVPQHDTVRGPNVITTTGSLNRVTLDSVRRAMMELPSKWLVRDTAPTVVVMLGGDNRRYRVTPAMVATLAARLNQFAQSEPMRLVLLASRRTPPTLVAELTAALGDTRVLTIADDEDNPYPGILGVADAMIVTSDSVNMASEVTITGKPVLIAGWRATNSTPKNGQPADPNYDVGETGRIAAFHAAMMAAGHTAPLGTALPQTRFTALDEIDNTCARLLTLLRR